ncbi:MAG TPA: thioredoxin fold domain-containing protein [Casimicrobiaceae bacterium]|nr:thioredoxin fold domain-containing protein [Casimicrobiaceae bacterium]
MKIGAIVMFALALAAGPGAAIAQGAAAQPIAIPPWFATTFLDFREDIADASREHKRLLVYFGQDGCPYCAKLMGVNFSQRAIVETTRRHFVAIALDIWGDRDTKWVDGSVMSEKELARRLGVQFTPTVLFFDEHARVVARIDGYWPPQRFEAVLDYVAGRREHEQPLASWLQARVKEEASPTLHDEPFFMSPPYDLAHRAGGKPLAVIFETVDCPACDELHREGFHHRDVMAQVRRFDVARFPIFASTPLVTPAGHRTTAAAWARELGIVYAPSVVFFDAAGAEVFRIDAYLRPFHFSSSFAYVAEKGYASEPSFQRWLRARAERLRAEGKTVDLWN